MNTSSGVEQSVNTNSSKQWFDELVSTIRTHELQLETKTAPKEINDFYLDIMSGDIDKMAYHGKHLAQKNFVTKFLVDYIELVKDFLPNKLAFDFNDSEVLVWAEIESDNTELERSLILAEAKLNSKYHQYGFDMSTTIVESDDQLQIPNHYRIFKA